MATLHRDGAERNLIVFVKGAVETVLPKCTSALDRDGRPVAFRSEEVQAQFEELAAQGLRVLAFARGELPADDQDLTHANLGHGLTFLGLQGMIDPPRADAMAAVEKRQRAGIQVKMITGDHALTAATIAQRVGLNGHAGHDPASATVVTGQKLEALSDKELIEIVDGITVFARVTPEQKLRLVRVSGAGHIVAMTGDGVNDAPALKQADIGVAMGVSGTEVAKEAADMVLTDDNFATIEAAVEEGRACLTI